MFGSTFGKVDSKSEKNLITDVWLRQMLDIYCSKRT